MKKKYKIKYLIESKEDDEFENNLYIENILQKLTPKERTILGHFNNKARIKNRYMGALIMLIGGFALVFEMLWILGV